MRNRFGLLTAVSTVAVIGSLFVQTAVFAYYPIQQIPVLTLVAPTLTLTTGVTSSFDFTPTIVFTSDEDGTISYSGDCSSVNSAAVKGSNNITFNELATGTHSNCKLTVTNINNNSSTLAIPSFNLKTIALAPIGPIMTPLEICSGFNDLLKSDADCTAITYVKDLGAMTGNPDGSFGPNDLLQRDQIAKIALVTFGKYVNGTNYCGGSNPFPDLDTNAWSYQYICRAKALALVTGYASGADKGFFRASRSVNRAEFLAILLRNLSDNLVSGDSYVDVTAGDWFNAYAKFSKDNGLFSGSAFNAGNLTTRREVAKVIYKLHTLGKI